MFAVERPRQARRRPLAVHASAVRSVALGDQRLHRRLRGAARRRSARRRPDDGGHARHRATSSRSCGVNPVMGRALDAADDDRAGGNPVIVLSDKGWRRRFDRDPNVLGRTVLVNGAPFEIVGVMPEGFRGLEVSAPDFWAPLSLLARVPAGRPRPRGQRRRRDHRPAETGRVDGERPRAARGVGLEPVGRRRRPTDHEHRARCRAAAPFRSRWKPSPSSRRCSSRSG